MLSIVSSRFQFSKSGSLNLPPILLIPMRPGRGSTPPSSAAGAPWAVNPSSGRQRKGSTEPRPKAVATAVSRPTLEGGWDHRKGSLLCAYILATIWPHGVQEWLELMWEIMRQIFWPLRLVLGIGPYLDHKCQRATEKNVCLADQMFGATEQMFTATAKNIRATEKCVGTGKCMGPLTNGLGPLKNVQAADKCLGPLTKCSEPLTKYHIWAMSVSQMLVNTW